MSRFHGSAYHAVELKERLRRRLGLRMMVAIFLGDDNCF